MLYGLLVQNWNLVGKNLTLDPAFKRYLDFGIVDQGGPTLKKKLFWSFFRS